MISEQQAIEAVGELGAIAYFPAGAAPQAAIMRALCAFVSGPRELGWLVDTAVNNMREWKGIAELRALYCVRFKPADGTEGSACTIAGYTPLDCEAANALAPVDYKQLGERDRAALKRLE